MLLELKGLIIILMMIITSYSGVKTFMNYGTSFPDVTNTLTSTITLAANTTYVFINEVTIEYMTRGTGTSDDYFWYLNFNIDGNDFGQLALYFSSSDPVLRTRTVHNGTTSDIDTTNPSITSGVPDNRKYFLVTRIYPNSGTNHTECTVLLYDGSQNFVIGASDIGTLDYSLSLDIIFNQYSGSTFASRTGVTRVKPVTVMYKAGDIFDVIQRYPEKNLYGWTTQKFDIGEDLDLS